MSTFKAIKGIDEPVEINKRGEMRLKKMMFRGKELRNVPVFPMRSLTKGYICVRLQARGRKRAFYLHRLVADAFVDNPSGHCFVAFKDDNKLNIQASNLEWVKSARYTHKGNPKLTSTTVDKIRRDLERGMKGVELACKYQISESAISRIKSGDRWS